MSSIVANARGQPGGNKPFCWQSLHVLRHLREVCESSNRISVASAQSVYVALTELSSDHRSASFQVAISEIARRSGLGYRMTATALGVIEGIGFLSVQSNYVGVGQLRSSNTYTLLRHDPALCKFCLALIPKAPTQLLPISGEEAEEERRERDSPSFLTSLPEWLTKAAKEYPNRSDIAAITEKFARFYASKPAAACYERLIEWIRTERNPATKKSDSKTDPGPEGWRAYLAQRFPVSEYPTRTPYENGAWQAVPDKLRNTILAEMNQASA